MEKINRALQTAKDDFSIHDLNVSLYDMDEAVKYYFDNVIRPTVEYDGEQVPVAVLYGSPERWTSIQRERFLRSPEGQLQSPVIVYRRTSIAKDDSMPTNKISAQSPQVFKVFTTSNTRGNSRYIKNSSLQNAQPSKELLSVVVPDYLILTYDVILFTDYLEQMNGLIESIIYNAGSYWGNERFKFRCKVTDYSDASEISTDTERIIRSNFSLQLFGYIVPKIAMKNMLNQHSHGVVEVSFGAAIDELDYEIRSRQQSKPVDPIMSNVSGHNQNQGEEFVRSLNSIFQYVQLQNIKQADIITSNTAQFSGASIALAPDGLRPATIDDFVFFVNGQLIEKSSIVSFASTGADLLLVVDVAALKFALSTNDVIVGIGKFA